MTAGREKKKARTSEVVDNLALDTSVSYHIGQENAKNHTSRPTRRAVRGRRGALKAMLDMPLDVLFEIFSRMHPRDLLNLARTSKDFRSLLMSRTSAIFWRAARQQIPGLPECPPFLSEPQYANLLFFSHCHGCLKANVKSILWALYVRYCPRCKEIMLIPEDDARVESLRDAVLEATNVEDPPFGMTTLPRRNLKLFAHLPEIDRFEKTWDSFATDAEGTRFALEQIELVKQRTAFASDLIAWKAQEAVARSSELDNLRQERIDEILKRLREDGFGSEIDDLDPVEYDQLVYHNAVSKAQKLTESAWQSIRPRLVSLLESLKQERLQRDRAELLRNRLWMMQTFVTKYEQAEERRTVASELRAQFSDLALMSPFRELMEAPSTTEITTRDLKVLSGKIPALRTEWLETRRSELIALIPSEAINPRDGVDVLSLATSTFYCNECFRDNLRWPNILAHSCAREEPPEYDLYEAMVQEVCDDGNMSYFWNSDRMFEFNRRWDVEKRTIAECGKDPDTATFEEMAQCRARLLCLACITPKDPYREAFDWKSAAEHKLPTWGLLTRCWPSKHKWKLLDPEESEKVIALELANNANGLVPPAGTKHCCAYCHYQGAHPTCHCLYIHKILLPKPGEDYYVHPDSPGQSLPRKPVRVYPTHTSEGRPIIIPRGERAILSSSFTYSDIGA